MGSQDQKLIIRPTSDDNVREFHLAEQITDLPYAEFFQPMYGSPEAEFNDLGTKGKEIADLLMDKRHEKTISRITFRPFSVRVYKSPTADWATVETGIVLPALKSVLGGDLQPVQYGTAEYREYALA
jgi:hypothetical protein